MLGHMGWTSATHADPCEACGWRYVVFFVEHMLSLLRYVARLVDNMLRLLIETCGQTSETHFKDSVGLG